MVERLHKNAKKSEALRRVVVAGVGMSKKEKREKELKIELLNLCDVKNSLLALSKYFYENVNVLLHANGTGMVNDKNTNGALWGESLAAQDLKKIQRPVNIGNS